MMGILWVRYNLDASGGFGYVRDNYVPVGGKIRELFRVMNETIHVTTIVGARPQFIKAAALSRVIGRHNLKSPGRGGKR